jgi:hypothetical protein
MPAFWSLSALASTPASKLESPIPMEQLQHAGYSLRSKLIFFLISHAASLPNVRNEVIANHDNNKWWPTSVGDWRLRILLAGWSTRISYSMVETYAQVVRQCNELGYDKLQGLSAQDFATLIKPLGLHKSREAYYRSVASAISRIEKCSENVNGYDNDALINYLQENVYSAGYKVAQCAALYAKGYHCGIMPVDSGMVEMLSTCLGEPISTGPIAHEQIRIILESTIAERKGDFINLIDELGFSDLSIPAGKVPSWWAHLVLIYYKRLWWNKNRSDLVFRNAAEPGKNDFDVRGLERISADKRNVILTGDDSDGIERIIEALKGIGYSTTTEDCNTWRVINVNKYPVKDKIESVERFNLRVLDKRPVLLQLCKSRGSLLKATCDEATAALRTICDVYGFISPNVSTTLMCSVVL